MINGVLFGLTRITLSPLPIVLPLPICACHYFRGRTVECFYYQLQNYLTFGLSSLHLLLTAIALFVGSAILLGRLWCGWICPLGFIQDVLSRVRRYLLLRHAKLPLKLNEGLGQFRYVFILLTVVIAFAIGMPFVQPAERALLEQPWCQVCPSKPLWMLLQGFLFILPWKSALSFTWTSWLAFLFFLICAFLVRRPWCRVCPLGGLNSLIRRFHATSIVKDDRKCTKCGVCMRCCPLELTEVYEGKSGEVTSSRCVLCLRCIELCPQEDCLKLTWLAKPVYASKAWWGK
ncbi:MAG: 4Fe-4S binding protein [Candidatus Hecatellaceae archaeon]